jgi:hypothetical protein
MFNKLYTQPTLLQAYAPPVLFVASKMVLIYYWCCRRLQSRAQSVHNRVYREAYGCGRKGGAHQTVQVLDGVQDVMDLLAGYRCDLVWRVVDFGDLWYFHW